MLGKRLQHAIKEHDMFSPGDTLIVGVSGGADSVALFHLLAALDSYRLRLVVAHVNHRLRGGESDDDEAFVSNLARDFSCPSESRRVDVAQYAEEHGASLEDAGRQVRYEFFQELKAQYSARAIVVAHTADDQAETFLMRLMRGACGTGLRAMVPITGRGVVRPLLSVTRDEIEQYLNAKGVVWRTDSSNADTSFLRNRIRAELLPLLKSYNPAIYKLLATTAHVLASDDRLLDSLTDDLFSRMAVCDENGVTLPVSELVTQPEALRRRLIRKAIGVAKGDLFSLSAAHIFAVESLLLSGKPNAIVSLPAGLHARRAYESLVITARDRGAVSFEIVIESSGEYLLPSGAHLVVSAANRGDLLPTRSDRVQIDVQGAPFPWVLRSFRAGDRIKLPGMDGRKKVKKVFMEQHVPLVERGSVPLLFSGDSLLWICGIRRSAEALPDPASEDIYTLQIKL